MSKQTSQPIPYTAQAPWYVRILGLPAVVVIVAGLWPTPTPAIFQVWQQSSWLFRLSMIVTAIVVLVGAAGLLFERTVFTETWIEHRTKFLRRVLKPYSEIESLIYDSQGLGRAESIKIMFSDGSKISIAGGEADIGIIIEILKACAGNQIVIRHR